MKNDILVSEEIKFDTRLIDNLIRDGKVEQQEYQEHLKNLTNEEGNLREIDVYEENPIEKNTPLATDALTFTSG